MKDKRIKGISLDQTGGPGVVEEEKKLGKMSRTQYLTLWQLRDQLTSQ